MDSSKLFALILAGGNGDEFWPLTRKSRSKQFLNLLSGKTLLEEALSRLEGILPLEHILILTNREQETSVAKLLPRFPRHNIISEPANRDTAAAIALGAAWVALRDHSATMIVLPADHLVKDLTGFRKTLQCAVEAAKAYGALVAVGVAPNSACPDFGYIELGEKVSGHREANLVNCHQVLRFREKPNAELAKTFLEAGNFRWNAGMYVWQIPAILSAFDRHAPEMAAFIERIHENRDITGALESQFLQLPKISIDYAVMEKASRVLAIEAAFDWDDVGTWPAISKHLTRQEHESSSNCEITQVNASRNLALSKSGKHVAFVGTSDLILVETEDAILVCLRDQTEKIKDLAARVPPELQ